MKPITREWVKKAEKDWVAAQVLHRQRKETQHDLVCFLSQQCAEKYLKARLKHAGSPVRRTRFTPPVKSRHDGRVGLGCVDAIGESFERVRS